MMGQKENRIQVYLKDIHRYIIEEVRKENDWESSVSDREIILYIMVEYDRLKQKEKKADQQLKYIDQHTTMILDLVASICSEMNVPQRPLEDCLPYFEAKEYMESLLNNRRAIRPSQSVQRTLQTPKAMRVANQIASQMHREATTQSTQSMTQDINPSTTSMMTNTERESKPMGSALGELLDKSKKQSTTAPTTPTIDEPSMTSGLDDFTYKNTLD